MMTAVVLALAVLGELLLGAAAIVLLRRGRGESARTSASELAGGGLALGIALTAWLLFVWSLCGGRLGRPVSWGLAATGLVAGAAIAPRIIRTLWRKGEGSRPTIAVRLLRGATVGVLIIAATQTVLTPQRFWDERAIFGIKSRVLYLDRTIHSRLLEHPDFVQGHPRYPLLVPLAETHIYALLGRDDDRWSKLVFPAMFGGLVLCYAGVLQRHTTAERSWLWALMLATAPLLFPYELGFQSGQADAPVACYHGLAMLYVWECLRHERVASTRPFTGWILAGLFAGAAAFTKDEGIAYLGIDVLALCMAWFIGFRSSGRRAFRVADLGCALILSAAPAVAGLAPWFWHRQSLPTTTEMNYFGRLTWDRLAGSGASLRWIVQHLFGRMFLEWRQWGLQWWLAAVALVSAPVRAARPEQAFLLLEIAGALAALAVAGLIAPADLHDHIGGSSHRYLIQIVPAALLFAAGQWSVTADPAPPERQDLPLPCDG